MCLFFILFPIIHSGQSNICDEIKARIDKGSKINNLDSVGEYYIKILNETNFDTCKKQFNQLHFKISQVHLDKGEYNDALSWINKLQLKFEKEKNLKGLGDVYNKVGSIYIYQNKYQDALEQFNLAIKNYILIKDSVSLGNSIGNVGICYDYLGKYDKAIESHLKSLEIGKKFNNLKCQANALGNISSVYAAIRNISKSIEYNLQALELKEKLDDKTALIITLNNLAEAYISLDSLDKSKLYLERSSELIKSVNSPFHEGYLYSAYSAYCVKLKDFINAEKYCLKQIDIFSKIDAPENLAGAKNKLAEIYHRTNRCKESVVLFEEILPTIKNDANLYYDCKKELSEVYACSQDYKKAYNTLIESNVLKDSVYNKEKINALQELETKYETEKKECIISQQNLEIKNKNMGLGLVGGGLLGAIGLATLLYRKRRQEQELNQLLDQQNRVLQDANQGLLHQLTIQRESDEVAQEPLMITLSNGSQSIVNIDDIQYFEAENNIVKIVLADGTVRHDYQRLKNFTELLKDSAMFIQIHRSYLVNVNHVSSHRANDLKMRSGDTLPIGITMKEKVHAKLKEKGV